MSQYAQDITFLPLAITANADLVAAVASKKIRVLSLFGVFTPAATSTMKFQTGAATDLTGAIPGDGTAALVLPYNDEGWFETAVGAKLNVVIANAAKFNGGMQYVLV